MLRVTLWTGFPLTVYGSGLRPIRAGGASAALTPSGGPVFLGSGAALSVLYRNSGKGLGHDDTCHARSGTNNLDRPKRKLNKFNVGCSCCSSATSLHSKTACARFSKSI